MALTNSSTSDCSNDSTIYVGNDKEAAELLYSPVEVVFYSIIVPCIMVVSFLSNFAFIFTVYRMPELRTITNAYLVNIAVADIIFVELDGFVHFVFPYMMSPLKLAVHFGQSECIIHASVNIFYYTSFILITCVAVERFLAICHPFYQQMVSGKSRTIKIIIASWLLGGIFAVGLQVHQKARLKTSCIVWPDGDKYLILPTELSTCEHIPGFPILLSVVGDGLLYLVGLVINLTMYTKIILTLKRRASDNLETHTCTNQRKVHNQVARLLVMNGVIFFVCLTPWQIANLDGIFISLVESHLLSNIHFKLLLDIGLCLNFVNSTVNPLVYMVCSSTYRNAYLKAFGVKPSEWTTGSLKHINF